MTEGPDAPAGQHNRRSDDVSVATLAAIGDVAAAGSTDVIESRLAQNDGIVSDDGALYARGIAVDVVGGFYVQNRGAGTAYGQRRGLSFGAGGQIGRASCVARGCSDVEIAVGAVYS